MFSASSRPRGLNQSTTNIPSECRIANIVRDHAMILPADATPKPDAIFGRDSCSSLQFGEVAMPTDPFRETGGTADPFKFHDTDAVLPLSL